MAKLTQPPSLALRWQANVGDHVIALAWSPDGAALAAASVSGPIVLYDAATGGAKYSLPGHGFGTTSLSWQPGGSILASSGQDGKARLWDANTGQAIAALDAGTSWVERVVWNPSGTLMISTAGKKLRLWNDKGEQVRAWADFASTVADVEWSAKGKEFAAAGYGGVTFYSPDANEPKTTFAWKGSVLAIAWSPDGLYVAGGAQDASVHFWIVKSGKDLEMTGYPQKVRELSWDSTGRFLATGGGNLITIWDCSGKGPAGSTPLSFQLHEEPVSVLAFQNRGPLLASACAGGRLALWYPGGSKKVLAQTKIDSGFSQALWSPNDGKLAGGGEDGWVGVWAV